MEIIPISYAVALIAALIGVLGAFQVKRYGGRREAATVFRSAVLAEFVGIYPMVTNWPEDIDAFCRAAFPRLQIAVTNFSASLTDRQRRNFDAAWVRFHCSRPKAYPDEQSYHHYMEVWSVDGPPKDPKPAFLRNVSNLLSFADET